MPPALERRPAEGDRPPLEIHRSPRRRRSASAAALDGAIIIRLPAGLAEDEEERLIAGLVRKVTGAGRAEALGGDDALARRAARLAGVYVDGVRPSSVTWSARMRRRHGSCTPSTGTIRISRELAGAPPYVIDHVLVHELAHLVVPDHSAAFHAILARHPDGPRADGWLEGFAAGRLRAVTAASSETADAASAVCEGAAAAEAPIDDPIDGGALG